MNLQSRVALNNGVEIPWLGLGVYKSPPGTATEQAVRWALELGYRHVDTASFYKNEEDVGNAIKKSGFDRSEIFVTSKIWNSDQGYESALRAFDVTRKLLDMDIIDLYLIHWPVRDTFLETWKALEKLYMDGKVRAIGVSNFLVHHLEKVIEQFDIVPAVNQVEFHPFLLQRELYEFDGSHDIRHEAWSPLTRGARLNNRVMTEIAEKHDRTPAQVFLRWDLQLGVVTIPKSVRRERIRENSEVFDFELDDEDMNRIEALDASERFGSDPDTIG